MQKQGVEIPEIENAPRLPDEVAYIWSWYVEVASVCDKITFSELKSWQDLKGFRLLTVEVDAIMALERVRRGM